ncbi:D-alanine--D-serine ligase VanG [Brevibacillus reuszeri]|uniref:D-alanine--D-serine ligase VanG n=1 Tax=Brevibacillus reuszeri TaxID=54915 RepID=UPI003D204639
MEKKTVAIIFGGCSNEYGVSLISAASVIEHIDKDKYNLVLIGITEEGKWLRYSGSIEAIREDRWHMHPSCIPSFVSPSRETGGLIELVHSEYHRVPIDVVFPVLHGRNGEDGTIQGLLELAGIPYVGCDMLSSAICMDKDIAHTLVRAAGIDTPRAMTIHQGDDVEKAIVAAKDFGYPVYIKPAKSGSSIGITKAHTYQQFIEGIELAFAHDNKIVIEENIEGFEVGCAVLGNSSPRIGVIDEIELSDDFFHFTEKYSLHTSTIHLPARIDTDTEKKVRETASLIYQTLGCSGFARVDMFLSGDGRLMFNEVNTIPGFTSSSRYPNMLRASGISYTQLLDELIELALGRDEK